ncbi:MATE family efflux transporter [Dysosmobacter sp.]|uniref:MATE family efflux transporter n=1 Tax=Dysosmobacter sp. TaxID=2591382 RepID=UPI002A8BEBD0|nr:MATE family efflux transporter [Dysosmobacter sp.]MDY3282455.1 MATE family efflux transporter [Dysosmobacter sp.]
MTIQLSDHFTYGRLLRFTLPSIVMMIFTSVYTVVDGIFVSNFVGKTSFAALNLIWPVIQLMGAMGFLLGTGGSALVARLLGEGKRERANRVFSLLVYTALVCGAALAAVGVLLLRPIAVALGAEGEMVKLCVLYGRCLLPFTPLFMLQVLFQSFLVVAERPKLGLTVTVAAGAANMVLDALFVAGFRWGLAGAALATGLSQAVGGLVPLVYFCTGKNGVLRLGRTVFDGKALGKTCSNGASEMMSNLSMSVVSILYNFQLLHLAGEDGVAAYGVVMYLNFIFTAVFLGFSVGSAPVISYHYGAGNPGELRSLFRKSRTVTAVSGVVMAAAAWKLAGVLSGIFVGYDPALMAMTERGVRIYAFSFLPAGLNIFGSAFFTALNNGAVSAAISFLRTLLFQVAAVLVLPLLWGLDGVWLAVVAAEGLSLCVTAAFLVGMRPRYHY